MAKYVKNGKLVPLGNGFSLVQGQHPNKVDDVDIGPNNSNGLSVNHGEIIQNRGKDIRVFSAEPMFNGVSPASLLYGGANPNKVFAMQEQWKKTHRVKDDGTKYQGGGAKRVNFSTLNTTRKRPFNEDFISYINDKFIENNIPAEERAIYLAHIIEESGGNPFADSRTGFNGLFQWSDERHQKVLRGDPFEEIDNQLDYFLSTVNNTTDKMSWTYGGKESGYKSLKNARADFLSNDFDRKARGFSFGYVRPAGKEASHQNRLKLAKQIYGLEGFQYGGNKRVKAQDGVEEDIYFGELTPSIVTAKAPNIKTKKGKIAAERMATDIQQGNYDISNVPRRYQPYVNGIIYGEQPVRDAINKAAPVVAEGLLTVGGAGDAINLGLQGSKLALYAAKNPKATTDIITNFAKNTKNFIVGRGKDIIQDFNERAPYFIEDLLHKRKFKKTIEKPLQEAIDYHRKVTIPIAERQPTINTDTEQIIEALRPEIVRSHGNNYQAPVFDRIGINIDYDDITEGFVHELRHSLDSRWRGLKGDIDYYYFDKLPNKPIDVSRDRFLLDAAYNTNNIIPFSKNGNAIYEKIATNSGLRQQLYNHFKIDYGNWKEFNKALDNISDKDLINILQNINDYGYDYANNIRSLGDKGLLQIANIKNALKYIPAASIPLTTITNKQENKQFGGTMNKRKKAWLGSIDMNKLGLPQAPTSSIIAPKNPIFTPTTPTTTTTSTTTFNPTKMDLIGLGVGAVNNVIGLASNLITSKYQKPVVKQAPVLHSTRLVDRVRPYVDSIREQAAKMYYLNDRTAASSRTRFARAQDINTNKNLQETAEINRADQASIALQNNSLLNQQNIRNQNAINATNVANENAAARTLLHNQKVQDINDSIAQFVNNGNDLINGERGILARKDARESELRNLATMFAANPYALEAFKKGNYQKALELLKQTRV